MSKVKLNFPIGEFAVTGKQITFAAPCDCSNVECIQIEGVDYCVVDALGNKVTGKSHGGVWCNGAQISVVLDCENKRAFVQNGNATPDQIGAVPTVAIYYNDVTSADDLIVPLAVIKVSATSNAELLAALGGSQSYAYVRTAFYSKATTVNSRVQTAYSYSGTPVRMAIRMFNQTNKVWTPWREIAGTDYALPRDGSAAMTGNLRIDTGTGSVASLIPYGGQLIVRNELDGANRQDVAFGQGTIRFLDTVNSVTNAYNILHTGNMESLLSGRAKIATGSYVGTGTSGASNQNSVVCGFKPALFVVSKETRDESLSFYGGPVWVRDVPYGFPSLDAVHGVDIIWDDTGLSWYHDSSDGAEYQLNISGETYRWVAIG